MTEEKNPSEKVQALILLGSAARQAHEAHKLTLQAHYKLEQSLTPEELTEYHQHLKETGRM